MLLATASIASAATQTLVFGDSLSDAGAARAAVEESGGTWPTEIYPEGQFTNGDTWAAKIGSTFESGYNFAFGGARAVENGDDSPDFGEQRQNFFASGVDLTKVSEVAIWFGGNDFRDLFAAGIPTPAGVTAASTAIIGEIIAGIGELSTAGLTDYVVFGMPDLSRLPGVVNTPFEGDVRAAVEGYDSALRASLANFAQSTGLSIDFLDVIGLTDDTIANADALGLEFLAEICLENPACAEDPNQFFFYDDIHPTSAVHDVIAAAFEDATSPAAVPLPAGFPLLLSGLVVIGLVSRRHRSRA